MLHCRCSCLSAGLACLQADSSPGQRDAAAVGVLAASNCLIHRSHDVRNNAVVVLQAAQGQEGAVNLCARMGWDCNYFYNTAGAFTAGT